MLHTQILQTCAAQNTPLSSRRIFCNSLTNSTFRFQSFQYSAPLLYNLRPLAKWVKYYIFHHLPDPVYYIYFLFDFITRSLCHLPCRLNFVLPCWTNCRLIIIKLSLPNICLRVTNMEFCMVKLHIFKTIRHFSLHRVLTPPPQKIFETFAAFNKKQETVRPFFSTPVHPVYS